MERREFFLIKEALEKGRKALSEYQSKRLLASYGIPVTREELAFSREGAIKAAKEIGFPVVIKACGPEIIHKTELALVELNLRDEKEVSQSYDKIVNNVKTSFDGVLVQEMIKGNRELVMGLIRDPQFGPCVMFGLGGIYTEILKDVSFRVAPLERRDALEMMREIKAAAILEDFRGQEPVEEQILCQSLINIGTIGIEYEEINEIDINPLIISGSRPVAVDALVVLN